MLTRGQLRWNYRQVLPDVYVAKGRPLTLRLRIAAAGRAAAALHGASWVSELTPVELDTPAVDEIVVVDGMLVTSQVRTALDLGRHLPRDPAVMHLDALARAAGVSRDPILALAQRYPGSRGVARAAAAIGLMDAGAESPKETWVRLVLIDAGLPRPRTQIRVSDGSRTAYIDLGWDEPMVGVDYEGDHHRSDRRTYVGDIGRYEMIAGRGWDCRRDCA